MDIVILLLVLVAALWDQLKYKIPNWLVATLVVVSVFALTLEQGINITDSLAGFGILFLPMFACFYFGLMGAGDVKLMAALGLYLGWQTSIQLLLLSFMFSGLYAIFILLKNRALVSFIYRWRMVLVSRLYIPPFPSDAAKQKVPFASAIALALFYCFYV